MKNPKFAPLILSIITTACSYRIAGVPTQHIVMVDRLGKLMDPTGSGTGCKKTLAAIAHENSTFALEHPDFVPPPTKFSWKPCADKFNGVSLKQLEGTDIDGYIDDIFKNMDAYFASRTKPGEREVRRVVLIVHGGLNSNQSNLASAQRLAKKIRDSGRYPVFILWQSNLWSALWEHMVNLRQGNFHGWRSGLPFAPFYLIGDLGRGIARAPVVWASSLENDFLSDEAWLNAIRKRPSDKPTEAVFSRLRKQREKCRADGKTAESCNAVDIQRGDDQSTVTEVAWGGVRSAPTSIMPFRVALHVARRSTGGLWTWLPTRYLLSPLLDALGSAAWHDMERRAILGFHSDEAVRDEASLSNRVGGISRFFSELQNHVQKTSCATPGADRDCTEWHLTLIGHSMGSIVVNHVVRNFDDLDFDSIVYMAAACSVRDYQDTVVTYMTRPKHATTQMYHLMLNPVSEIRDQYFYSIPPGGSLLVWIDRFFTQPHTIRDRTAGRWDNVVRFLEETPDDLRGRVHVHAFAAGNRVACEQPQHHGAFSDFPFWCEEWWKTDLTDLGKSPTPSQCVQDRKSATGAPHTSR